MLGLPLKFSCLPEIMRIEEEILEENELLELNITEEEIKENFKLITHRPISQRTISVGKCIAKIAQWHIIEVLKLGLMPLRVGNYYLIKADLLDELFKNLDKNSIEQLKKDKSRKS
jgi:hypothetical protein